MGQDDLRQAFLRRMFPPFNTHPILLTCRSGSSPHKKASNDKALTARNLDHTSHLTKTSRPIILPNCDCIFSIAGHGLDCILISFISLYYVALLLQTGRPLGEELRCMSRISLLFWLHIFWYPLWNWASWLAIIRQIGLVRYNQLFCSESTKIRVWQLTYGPHKFPCYENRHTSRESVDLLPGNTPGHLSSFLSSACSLHFHHFAQLPILRQNAISPKNYMPPKFRDSGNCSSLGWRLAVCRSVRFPGTWMASFPVPRPSPLIRPTRIGTHTHLKIS